MLPTTLRLGLLAAIVLLAAGCGSGGTPEPPPEAPPTIPTGAPPPSNRPVPATPDPLVATPPAGAGALPAERVDAGALPAGLPTLVWTRGDRVVGVYGRAGGCTDARAEVVEQGADRVVLRVVQFSTGPGPCTRELVYPPLEVTLDAPLGERRVVLTGAVP
ncbi:hypothetical protein Acsp06_14330 [Actinomycetospora sp. NBRC 106375]|nr:hypothetical protein Acsp06_14330 [Actinomycetospora sp. NBRC 106375]